MFFVPSPVCFSRDKMAAALSGGGITSKVDVTYLNFFLKEFNAVSSGGMPGLSGITVNMRSYHMWICGCISYWCISW